MIKFIWIIRGRLCKEMKEKDFFVKLNEESGEGELTEFVKNISDTDFVYINFDRNKNNNKDKIKIWIGKVDEEIERSIEISKNSKIYIWINRYAEKNFY